MINQLQCVNVRYCWRSKGFIKAELATVGGMLFFTVFALDFLHYTVHTDTSLRVLRCVRNQIQQSLHDFQQIERVYSEITGVHWSSVWAFMKSKQQIFFSYRRSFLYTIKRNDLFIVFCLLSRETHKIQDQCSTLLIRMIHGDERRSLLLTHQVRKCHGTTSMVWQHHNVQIPNSK